LDFGLGALVFVLCYLLATELLLVAKSRCGLFT